MKIAEARGWKRSPELDYTCHSLSGPTYGKDVKRIMYAKEGRCLDETSLPDFFSDLNAMNAAEKSGLVTERQIETYLEALTDACGGDTPIGVASFTAYFASAAQRAEAFGKTLGLW